MKLFAINCCQHPVPSSCSQIQIYVSAPRIALKECHPRCVYQIYNRLIINNDSHLIYQYGVDPPQQHTHSGHSKPTISDTRPPCLKNQPRGATDHHADTLCANTVSATIPIFVNEISSPPSHLHLDQTDNFPQMLYSNLKMAESGRNM